MSKIGIGIVTCNRNNFFNKCIESIKEEWYDELVVVNDGDLPLRHPKINIINNTKNLGVCKSKNILFKELLNANCDFIFIVEDDMVFKDNAFQAYINAHKKTGIHHMMFGYHGPINKGNVSKGTPRPRKVIDYGDFKLALNSGCVGAVCFYTKESLKNIGIFDEDFNKNNFEHVEHSYRLAKAGYSTPYWWWSDLANSPDYIEEQACSEDNSAIRRGDNWQQKIFESAEIFKKKHGYMPAWQNSVPDTNIEDIVKFLKKLKK
jgi:GT2 family glycosyltransferase|tara:strand:- start:293 stop:1078 length:786 start_codon:yes stop_codon:yes gene_type:complete